MFFKSKRDPLNDNYNPGVGLYDIITKLDNPTTIIHKDSSKIRRQSQQQIEPLISVERKIDLNDPLHSYASGVQRVRQNKIYQTLKKQIINQHSSHFERDFDSQVKQTIKKGKLCKLKKLPHNSTNSLNESASLCLGSQSTVTRKTSGMQYLKHPPKIQSLDSLELFLLRDKLQKVTDNPGPGSYELPSVFKLSESRVQPFGKQQGRTNIVESDNTSVGVGQYNIQDSQIIKSVIRFDKYSKRASLFENKNSPTYYDNAKILIPNQTKVNLEFPVVFGSTSKR